MCVGFILSRPLRSTDRSVHPHVRGVYTFKADGHTVHDGSSPRAWGLFFVQSCNAFQFRFIPTCVGFMSPARRSYAYFSVHPHVRGVYSSATQSFLDFNGSSPRAWGLCVHAQPDPASSRFIPTCVGFIRIYGRKKARKPVHPHVRGVYGIVYPAVVRLDGSSPRAWGLYKHPLPYHVGDRFIPTCVGFMVCVVVTVSVVTVHPHVRGVYSKRMLLLLIVCGSSPRAWGLYRRI